MRKLRVLLFLFITSPLFAGTQDFWSYWGDGKAELSGYELTQPRYGALRKGKAVMIFVTEDHSVKERVKIDGDVSQISTQDKFSVFKLNFSKKFQTGVYDYSVLTSVFARVDNHFSVSKVSLSVQEWCGHIYHQLVEWGDFLSEDLHSYFGGEADQKKKYVLPSERLYEDNIPILIRELNGEWIKAGEEKLFIAAPSLLSLRFKHKAFSWTKVQIKKESEQQEMNTSIGKKMAVKWISSSDISGTTTYWVDAVYPHVILKWQSDSGEEGILSATTRLPYWSLHNNGDEKYLNEIFKSK